MRATVRALRYIPLLLGCLAAGVAAAEDPGPVSGYEDRSAEDPGSKYDRPGFYVVLGAATGFTTRLEDEAAAAGVPLDVNPATGFSGRIGASAEVLASEVQFEYLSFDGQSSLVPGVTAPLHNVMIATGNLKLQTRFDRFQPYVLFGAGLSYVSVDLVNESATDLAIRGGGGANVFITEKIALAVDVTYVWTGYRSNEFLDYVSIAYGLMYKF